jgi:hypothetical protein
MEAIYSTENSLISGIGTVTLKKMVLVTVADVRTQNLNKPHKSGTFSFSAQFSEFFRIDVLISFYLIILQISGPGRYVSRARWAREGQ